MSKSTIAFYKQNRELIKYINYNLKYILYGSELSVLKLAETLTDIYEVYIFVNINEDDEIKYNCIIFKFI